MKHHLSGGILIILIILSAIDFQIIFEKYDTLSIFKNLYDFITPIISIVISFPIAYLINQLWMIIYNIFFDVHIKILPLPSKIELVNKYNKKTIWNKSYINEVLLAFSHRKRVSFNSDQFISWHRNRLIELHSNATNFFSLCIGFLIITFIILSNQNYFIDSIDIYIRTRFWFIIIVLIFILVSFVRALRAYKMLILYNQLALISDKEG